MITQDEDQARQGAWRKDRTMRVRARIEEQAAQHGADPAEYVLPVDDEEFPDESYTASWEQEEGS